MLRQRVEGEKRAQREKDNRRMAEFHTTLYLSEGVSQFLNELDRSGASLQKLRGLVHRHEFHTDSLFGIALHLDQHADALMRLAVVSARTPVQLAIVTAVSSIRKPSRLDRSLHVRT